jgi:hypothetical protein
MHGEHGGRIDAEGNYMALAFVKCCEGRQKRSNDGKRARAEETYRPLNTRRP